MQAINDATVKSFGDSYSLRLEIPGIVAFLPEKVFLGFVYERTQP
jgi:hypothetical protein